MEKKPENHILPFFWMHGEPHEDIIEEIDKVCECGIREICIESRPHPDFCGDHWWRDVDLILSEAKKRDMRVWVLDDNRFPTGNANGAFASKHPDKRKLYLAERHMDIIGPAKNQAVLIAPYLPPDAALLCIAAFPKPDGNTLHINSEGAVNLTDRLHDGFVYLDIPEGAYRLFLIFTTRTGGGRENYMNLIDTESVRVLIDTVYEAHYARYKEEFGKTFAGFFSDEPELGNLPGYDFHGKTGRRDVRMPWSDELGMMLRELWGDAFALNLPLLWYTDNKRAPQLRYQYMDAVTTLVEKCFSRQIGQWCAARGVEYIGHIIEDDNAHARMGCSVGHYYRGLRGQHMSGIDLVHFQILPGFTEPVHQWLSFDGDGEFFHFCLARLASSAARIEPHKRGRALCEIFGNYGWAEGTGLMKWLIDHMLVRGINYFVPHAFNPTFPDRDCPPHFYARGHNPQFKMFAALMRYTNRLASLLSGGKRAPCTAILYHGDLEWCGLPVMLSQKPARVLTENLIDFDILPLDALETASKQDYTRLIVPQCTALPEKAADLFITLADKGWDIIFLEEKPQLCLDRPDWPAGFETCGRVLPLSALAEPTGDIKTASKFLRVWRKHRDDGSHVLMLFNESVAESIAATVTLPEGCSCLTRYDALLDLYESVLPTTRCLEIPLAPGESAVYIMGGETPEHVFTESSGRFVIDCGWAISASRIEEYPNFASKWQLAAGTELPNLNAPGYDPSFVGIYRYEGSFTATGCEKYLRFPRAGDGGEVWINNEYAGCFLGNGSRVPVSALVKEGRNTIAIELPTTLLWAIRDGASASMQAGPTGLIQAPELID